MENNRSTSKEPAKPEVTEEVSGDESIGSETDASASTEYRQIPPTTDEHELPTQEIDKSFLERVGKEIKRHRRRRR